ncbi:MAG: NYN domain-containing protein [Lachnospiraceae bacterium]|nr:NYN domain-containing protein [Lachnospiraceae bacterium]
MDEKKFALLIDADNVSSKYIKTILDELAKYGTVTYKRLYGDLTRTNNKSWRDALLSHSIIPMQQFNYTTGKNSTDSAMIIDAMDILYSGHVDGFCLASSDSDFTRLAMRLRESGMTVIGMGERKTPEAFRDSCERFLYLDLLSGTASEEETDSDTKDEEAITPLATIEAIIIKIIMENGINGSSMDIGELGSRITKFYSAFDIRNYGYTKFSKFLEQFNSIRLNYTETTVTAELMESDIPLDAIEAEIVAILDKCDKKTAYLSQLSNMLLKKYPNFDIHNYGYSRFSKMLSEFKSVKIGAFNKTVTLIAPPAPVTPVKKASSAPKIKGSNQKGKK